jgi:hypothetical protein
MINNLGCAGALCGLARELFSFVAIATAMPLVVKFPTVHSLTAIIPDARAQYFLS